MNIELGLLWNNAAPMQGDGNRAVPASLLSTPAATASDLAWQHAMEHARQADMSDWFKPLPAHQLQQSQQPQQSRHASGANTPHAAGANAGVTTTARSGWPPAVASGRFMSVASSMLAAATVPAAGEPAGAVLEAAGPASNDKQAGSDANASAALSPPLANSLSAALAEALAGSAGLPVLPVSSRMSLAVAGQPDLPFTADADAASASAAPLQPDQTNAAQLAGGSGVPQHEPVRLYAEWSSAGVHIWLGADHDHAMQLAQLPQQLQHWLAQQGDRLAGLIYNGRTLWRSGSVSDVSGTSPDALASNDNRTSSGTDSVSVLSQRLHQEVLCQPSVQ